jgi:alkanesulfonate monooxygenase SsuD/methylene tetrahydromethanopterin reductase-like flavin-dependent oxidoreductase (luciferase family)
MAQGESVRGRIGFNIRRSPARQTVELIQQIEQAGVEMAWMTMSATGVDVPTIFAAALVQTERIRLGTSIIPAFTKHPLGLATQTLALSELAPDRIRIGIGTSHGPTMAAYGVDLGHPLDWLREYLTVTRTATQQGKVTFAGEYFNVDATMTASADVPLLVSALRPNAWELAGEASDGGISWLCPVDYLLREAKPAMQRGAQRAGRDTPPLVAHIPVALSTDRAAVREAARKQFAGYARLPFYAKMFEAAGYPVGANHDFSDALLDHLVISGNDDSIAQQLTDLLAQGLDELLVMPITISDPASEDARLLKVIGGM